MEGSGDQSSFVQGLRSSADELIANAEKEKDSSFAQPLARLEAAANSIGRSWSGSNLGYQADVYYKNFEVPPPRSDIQFRMGV